MRIGNALGAIHIMIGLVHFGLGAIMVFIILPYGGFIAFSSFAVIGGYPLWGGVCYIVTGVLTLLGIKKGYSCLVKSSLGLSIVSGVLASVGIILLLIDVIENVNPQQNHWALVSGKGASSMMITFSLLEICISSVTAHLVIEALFKNNVLF